MFGRTRRGLDFRSFGDWRIAKQMHSHRLYPENLLEHRARRTRFLPKEPCRSFYASMGVREVIFPSRAHGQSISHLAFLLQCAKQGERCRQHPRHGDCSSPERSKYSSRSEPFATTGFSRALWPETHVRSGPPGGTYYHHTSPQPSRLGLVRSSLRAGGCCFSGTCCSKRWRLTPFATALSRAYVQLSRTAAWRLLFDGLDKHLTHEPSERFGNTARLGKRSSGVNKASANTADKRQDMNLQQRVRCQASSVFASSLHV